MRLRFGILALVLVAAVSGCGGDDKKNASSDTSTTTAPSSEPTDSASSGAVPCAAFFATNEKVLALQAAMQPGVDSSQSIAAIEEEFNTLKEGAPADVQAALDDLKDAAVELNSIYKDPMNADAGKAQTLITRLGQDYTTVGTYVAAKCAAQ